MTAAVASISRTASTVNVSALVEMSLSQGLALVSRGISLLTTEMPWLAPFFQVLNSVFIEGDASPEVSVQVMSACAAVLFLLVSAPKAAPAGAIQQRGHINRLSQA